MATLEFDLENLEYGNNYRQYLIDNVITDEDKWNIAYDCFQDDPETFMMWVTDDLLDQHSTEYMFGKDRLIKLYNHLKTFYE